MPTLPSPVSPGDVLLGRGSPHSLEAEMGVLGSMILNPDCIGEVIEAIDAEAYFKQAHRSIHEAIVDLFLTQRGCDLVILKDELVRRGQLDQAGGIEYLASLVETVPTAANATHYAA